MLKKFINLRGVIALALVGVVSVVSGWFYLDHWSRHTHPLGQESILFDVPSGTGLKSLSQDLFSKNIIDHPVRFSVWARLSGSFQDIKAGHYKVHQGVSPQQLLLMLREGKTWHELLMEWTIPEGFTLNQIIARVSAISQIPESGFFELAENRPLVRKLLRNHGDDFEGFLFPATYKIYDQQPDPESILSQMTSEFFRRLPDQYLEECERLGLNLKEAVTFASLIEKETRIPDERSLVSEVIWNRLKKGISLGIDAAIIYGIPNFDGNLRRKHLSDRGNKYNTRVHGGLPPGPIGSPGLESLKAVLTPTDKGNYYYVLLPDSGGRHHFSKTLREHNQYVRKLVRAQRQRR